MDKDFCVAKSEQIGRSNVAAQCSFCLKGLFCFVELEGTFNEQFSPFPRFAVSDPRVYIICVDGLPRLQSCGAHDLFDQETLTCRRQPPAFGK